MWKAFDPDLLKKKEAKKIRKAREKAEEGILTKSQIKAEKKLNCTYVHVLLGSEEKNFGSQKKFHGFDSSGFGFTSLL